MSMDVRSLPNGAKDDSKIAYQATIYIPLTITAVCTVLDLVSKSRIAHENILDLFYICSVIISYFFPSILATALGMMWIEYFGNAFSGIKKGYGLKFSAYTGLLFIIYIISLFFSDYKITSLVFLVVLCAYLNSILRKCMDRTVLRNIGLQETEPDITKATDGGKHEG